MFVLAERPGSTHTPTLPNGDGKARVSFYTSLHVPLEKASFDMGECEKLE